MRWPQWVRSKRLHARRSANQLLLPWLPRESRYAHALLRERCTMCSSGFVATGPPSPFGQKKRKADASDSSGSKAVKPITSKWFAEMEEVGEDDEDDEDDDST